MNDPYAAPPRTAISDTTIRIRPHDVHDIVPLYDAVTSSEAELAVWMAWVQGGYTLEHATAWILSRPGAWADHVEYAYAVDDLATGRLLGGVGLGPIDTINRRANLGYWVRSDHAGHGAATAAAKLLVRAALHEFGIERIEIIVAVENLASVRVAEKLGAELEGTLRRRLRLCGRMHDAHLFSLVRGAARV